MGGRPKHSQKKRGTPVMKLTKADIDKVRHMEGFPIAKDEDIIALSRPPYYTACPNPFIEDFILEHGTLYDEATDDYHREPFAVDVIGNKYDKLYHFHPYHTKVPYQVISDYISHYTQPGDIVFDGFCGSGMTALGASYAKNTGRACILNDLSPICSYLSMVTSSFREHLSNSYVCISNTLQTVEEELKWMFTTKHSETGIDGLPIPGEINYVIWSDVYICPSCSKEYVFWEVAVDFKNGKIKNEYDCPCCGARIAKGDSEHLTETFFDTSMQYSRTRSKQVPVRINYSVGTKRYEKLPSADDLDILSKIEEMSIPYWHPTDSLPEGDNTTQPITSHGFSHVHDFYFKRDLWVLATAFDRCDDIYARVFLTKVAFRITKRYGLTYQNGSWGAGGGPTNGTLYIPSLVKELPILRQIKSAVDEMIRANFPTQPLLCVSTQSTSQLTNVPNNSIDYIYTDPPFGSNLNYSELNFIWEAWLKVRTNNIKEAIVNKSQGKGIAQYQRLVSECFSEYSRILKPGRWITVVFHNSSNAVWIALQESLMGAGFIIADIRVMDKGKMSFKQITTKGSVKADLVISAYKPKESFVREFQQRAGDPEMAWEFVRQHLTNVPIAPDGNHDGKIDMVAERCDYLLFDRMVAWHIMSGIPVPMDAHTFYGGLRQRFLQRDGMFFLPDQVNVYDEKRTHMELDTQQLYYIVSDEKNAIAWLNYILAEAPKTYQEIQPIYLQELHQSKQEKMPELLDMLKENFVQDDEGRWYIPDLTNAADLAKLRTKKLLKEFYDSYVPGKGKLKVFRLEAIRAGFDDCWANREYKTILAVGDRLPETVLQEDAALLMYYDNASNRI
jgi:DNA modification methylase